MNEQTPAQIYDELTQQHLAKKKKKNQKPDDSREQEGAA